MKIKNIHFMRKETPAETYKRIFGKSWPGGGSKEIQDMQKELGISKNVSSGVANIQLQKALLNGWRPSSFSQSTSNSSDNSNKDMNNLDYISDDYNDEEFETSDFYLTVFLRTKGLKIKRINKNNPRSVKFVFENSQLRRSLVKEYLYGNPEVNVKDFINSIREVKNLIYLD